MDTLSVQKSIEVIEKAEAAILTTIDFDGYPSTRAMLNLHNPSLFPGLVKFFEGINDELTVFFTTNTSSHKISHIRRNQKTSVYYCLPKEWRGLMLAGNIETVDDREIKKALWIDGWEKYYPTGVNDPDYTILRFVPDFVKGYHSLTFYSIDFRGAR